MYKHGLGIQQCFRVLGYEKAFRVNHTFVKYEDDFLDGLAEDLYLTQMKRFHPDKHFDDFDYYNNQTIAINHAYKRIKYLVSLRRERSKDDVWNHVEYERKRK